MQSLSLPLLFLLLATTCLIKLVASDVAFQCPSRFPSTCECETSPSGLRVTCANRANLTAIVSALTNATLASLDVRDCYPRVTKIDWLPHFRVRSLTVAGCGVESISPDALFLFRSDLKELVLANNSLTTFSVGALYKLEVLDLSGNRIEDIPEDALPGAFRLRRLILANNKICELGNTALIGVKSTLELLDLHGNCLTAIPAESLQNSAKLSHIDLSHNEISELSFKSFTGLSEFAELLLNNNKLSKLSTNGFANLKKFRRLEVRGNAITSVSEDALDLLKGLEVISLADNKLTGIPHGLKKLPVLKEVYLGGNKITSVDTETFGGLSSVKVLDLGNNRIRTVEKNAFDGCENLAILILANNSLNVIDQASLSGIKNLQELDLAGNNLTQLTPSTFASVSTVGILGLANNKIAMIDAGTFDNMDSLYWVDLSNNAITTLEKDTFKRKIDNLLLDGNKINCDDAFDWFIFYVVQNGVRTVFLNRPQVTCGAPPKFAGVPITDLALKKFNETMVHGLKVLGLPPKEPIEAVNRLADLMTNSGSSADLFNTISQTIPGFKNFGVNSDGGSERPAQSVGSTLQHTNPFDLAIERITEPLVRISTGEQTFSAEMSKLANSLPNLINTLPGVADVDLTKLPAPVLQNVLTGGTLPGVSRQKMDTLVQNYVHTVYAAMNRAELSMTPLPGDTRYIPVADALPKDFITDSTKKLPFLSAEQSDVIRKYYQRRSTASVPQPSTKFPSFTLPELKFLSELLPEDFGLGSLSPKAVSQVMKGEFPDPDLLPKKLIDYVQNNTAVFEKAIGMAPENSTLSKFLEQLRQMTATSTTTTTTTTTTSMPTTTEPETTTAAKSFFATIGSFFGGIWSDFKGWFLENANEIFTLFTMFLIFGPCILAKAATDWKKAALSSDHPAHVNRPPPENHRNHFF